ncbi:MAG: DNA replication/repair protein RecF [Flavobacteriales bacterium]|jgi:DNA replication and repair protein RecF
MKDVQLHRLMLYQFKNYHELNLEFGERIVCFLGANGSGKTNVLDAIVYLCTCKSYFNPIDSQNIAFNEQQFAITGEFSKGDQPEHIVCAVKRNQRKVFKRNHKEYERLLEHIGLLPCIIITPYDIELIWEGSEVRRRFLDSTISQLSKSYLEELVAYNHALLQRNTVLKTYSGHAHFPEEFIELWDVQLIQRGAFIHEERSKFMSTFTSVFNRVYSELCGGAEMVSVVYESELQHTSMEDLLQHNRKRDRQMERTTAGVHRDDLSFLIDGHPLKKFASQGQQKTFLFALKFAQYLMLREHLQINPILLLDDFFDKMDEHRVNNMLSWLEKQGMGQIFITDTGLRRVPDMLAARGMNFEAWEVNRGKLVRMESGFSSSL